MFKRRMSALGLIVGMMLVLASALGGAVPRASAVTFTGTVILDCAGYDGSGATATLNRNNTGLDTESYIIEGRDGYGNQIY